MAAKLITVQEAKDALRLMEVDDERADALELKMWIAEELVLKYVERIDTGWTVDTVPLQIKGAILAVTAYLWEHEGDEEPGGDPLSRHVRSLLKMFRDPVIA